MSDGEKNLALPIDGEPSRRYRHYVIGILFVVYTFNFIDRQILSILAEPIKRDLQLSDTQLGFMTGLAFAIFYATLGIPIARLADRHSRVKIISIALAAWSVMTALSGLALNFWQIVVARIGVGVGEAGCSPPAHSLIADYFPANERSTALGLYALGIPIGSVFGLLVGGWINEFFGWRMAFFVVGIPGIILALIVRYTLREPKRGAQEAVEIKPQDRPPLAEVMSILWHNKTFRHLSLGGAMAAFAGYGIALWIAPFYMRLHNMGTAEISSWLALYAGVGGALGTAIGGKAADILARRDIRFYTWLSAITLAGSAPFFAIAFMLPDKNISLAMLALPYFLTTFWYGSTFSTAQNLVPPQMRALTASIMLFIMNLIGLGLGPQLVGIASDLLQPSQGEDALRYALVGASLALIWAAFHFAWAGKTLADDLEKASVFVASKPDR